MKKILTLLICLAALNSFAQKKQYVYYFKDGIPTKEKESADCRRIIQEPDSGSTLYSLYEFYSDNTNKTIGFVSNFDPDLTYEGELKCFNEKGILTGKCNYKNGKLIGESTSYFNDGKIKEVNWYNEDQSKSSKLISAFDSIGTQMVKDGNGYYKMLTGDEDMEEGNYLNGYKDGIWKGKWVKGTYEEIYNNGILKSGKGISNSGEEVNYTESFKQPSFPGGIDKFYKYLGKTYKFPSLAFKNKVDGRLYTSFVVLSDGSLSEIKFRNDLGYGTQEEAVRVLTRCPKWIPGNRYGFPVRVLYKININLSQK